MAGENEGASEDSFSRISLVAWCSPENQRLAVEWCGYIRIGALAYKHAETQVRNGVGKETPGASGRSVGRRRRLTRTVGNNFGSGRRDAGSAGPRGWW